MTDQPSRLAPVTRPPSPASSSRRRCLRSSGSSSARKACWNGSWSRCCRVGTCCWRGCPGWPRPAPSPPWPRSWGAFQRIQFTPDLVPSDLVGTRIWRPDQGGFETELGPVHCNFLLADEINRAPAKVQSALLEVMQEHQVTIGKQTFRSRPRSWSWPPRTRSSPTAPTPSPRPRSTGSFMKVVVDYPNFSEEMTIVARSLVDPRHHPDVVAGPAPGPPGPHRHRLCRPPGRVRRRPV